MVQKIRHRACASNALFRGGAARRGGADGRTHSPRPSHCPVKSFKSASERERRGGEAAAVRLDRRRELVAAVPLIFEQQMIGRLVFQWASRENRLGWVGESAKSASRLMRYSFLQIHRTSLAAPFRSLHFGLSFSLNY